MYVKIETTLYNIIQIIFPIFYRKLLKIGMRNSICSLNGLLLDSDLYSIWSHRYYILGIILVESKRHTCPGRSRRDNCVDYDHSYVIN